MDHCDYNFLAWRQITEGHVGVGYKLFAIGKTLVIASLE